MLTLFPQILYAQEYLINADLITTDDGLANQQTNTLLKSKDGYLWVGTRHGLNRYDGYSFKLYDKQNNDLFANEDLSSLQEDDEGNIWIFHGTPINPFPYQSVVWNIDILQPKTEKVISFDKFFKGKTPFQLKDVVKMKIADAKNRFWITTTSALYLYQNKTFKKVLDLKGEACRFITIDENEAIYLVKEQTIQQYNTKGNLIEEIKVDIPIWNFWKDKTTLWIATSTFKTSTTGKLLIYKKEQGQPLQPFSLTSNGKVLSLNTGLYTFIQRSKNGYWFLNIEDSLMIFNKNGTILKKIKQFNDKVTYAAGANSFLEDESHYWISSPMGLIKIKFQKNPFQVIHQKVNISDLRGIAEDEEHNIYFIDKYIYKYDLKSKKKIQLPSDINAAHVLFFENNALWAGIYAASVIGQKINLATNEKTYYSDDKGGSVNCALKSEITNQYLVGGKKGLSYINMKNPETLPFLKYNSFDILKKVMVNYIHKNAKGIWLATTNGLFLMTETEGVLNHYSSQNSDLPFDYLQHIHEDKEGNFWLATKGGGIIKWQPPTNGKKAVSQQFTMDDGLSINYIYAIYNDDYGNFWASSDKGLMCIQKEDFVVRTYLEKDGLPHYEFNFTSHFKSTDGSLYFGGLGGLIRFHPKDFVNTFENNTPLQLVKYLKLENEEEKSSELTNKLATTKTITFDRYTKFVELQFALMDFEKEAEHIYAYKIEGYSDVWNYITENNLRITTLPYGTYTLRIKGKNHNSNWSEKELVLTIVSKCPFYFRWWFLFIIVLAIVATVLAYIAYRTSMLKNEAEALEKIVEQRTQKIKEDKEVIEKQAIALTQLDKLKSAFFNNVTHELRTPLTLILAPLDDLMNKENLTNSAFHKTTIIKQHAKKLSELVDELLDLSKMEANKLEIEKQTVHFHSFIKRLFSAFQSYADYRKISWQLDLELEEGFAMAIDTKKTERIINNLLINALKYTNSGGEVRMLVQENINDIQIHIIDTGHGIHPDDLPYIFDRYYQSKHRKADAGGIGVGLALSQQYAQLLNGSLSVESELEVGSVFTFILPMTGVTTLHKIPKDKIIPIEYTEVKSSLDVKKMTVLITEDNLEMAEYLNNILSTQYNTLIADNGKAALQILKNKQVDLIFSDVMMPEMNGFEFLEIVKQHKTWKNIPFVMLTARIELQSKLSALRIGVDDYITKPFVSEELLVRANNLLENYKIRKTTKPIINISIEEEVSTDNQWLQEMENIIKNSISDKTFNVSRLAFELHISERNLFDKMKSLVGMTPGQYLKEVRLMQAKALLEAKIYKTIAEVCYAVGFQKPSYFSQIFKKRFGKSPSDY